MDRQILEKLFVGVRKLGFAKAIIQDDPDSRATYIIYSIQDRLNKCDPDWNIFPLIFSVSNKIITFKIIFSIQSHYFIVDKRDKAVKNLKAYMNKVNCYLRVGFFYFDSREKKVSFTIKQLSLETEDEKLSSKITDEGVAAYTAFAFGLYQILCEKNPKVDELVKIGLKRYRRACSIQMSANRAKLAQSLDITKEKYIMQVLRNHNFLDVVFLINKYAITKNEELMVPIIQVNARHIIANKVERIIKPKYTLLQECKINYKICKKLQKILLELCRIGLKFKSLDLAFRVFAIYKGDIYYNYSDQLSQILDIFDLSQSDHIEHEIYLFLTELSLSVFESSSFDFSDIFIEESSKEKQNEYFGISFNALNDLIPIKKSIQMFSNKSNIGKIFLGFSNQEKLLEKV